jgi:hypothetical protein
MCLLRASGLVSRIEAIIPYECHERSIGLKDMLEIARAHDFDVR